MGDFFRRLLFALTTKVGPLFGKGRNAGQAVAPPPSFCPKCGTSDRKLAECSTCGVWFCAGECYSLHKRSVVVSRG